MLSIVHAANIFDHQLKVINVDYAPAELDGDYIKKCDLKRKDR